MGGFAARVVAGLQELVEVDGDPDAGDAAVLGVRPADDGEGLDIPVGEVLLPALGRLGLALTLRPHLSPFSLTYGGERGVPPDRLARFTGLPIVGEPGCVQHGPS
jgi:hypothetical protein